MTVRMDIMLLMSTYDVEGYVDDVDVYVVTTSIKRKLKKLMRSLVKMKINLMI